MDRKRNFPLYFNGFINFFADCYFWHNSCSIKGKRRAAPAIFSEERRRYFHVRISHFRFAGVDLGEHQKKTIPLAFLLTIIMLIAAVVTGGIAI